MILHLFNYFPRILLGVHGTFSKFGFQEYFSRWYKLSHSTPPPPNLMGKVKKRHFFPISYSPPPPTFARRTKKLTFVFVKKCTKNCFFYFLEVKSHFPNLCFLHHVLTRQNEKYIKNCKILIFFFDFESI